MTTSSTSPHHKTRPLPIGCASGFWGDSEAGATQLVRDGQIDWPVFDYLAGIIMSLLARAKAKSPDAGYAPDFVNIIAELAPELQQQGIRIISNAGGVNPQACAQALAQTLAAQNISMRIAVVQGDDLSNQLPALQTEGIRDMGFPIVECEADGRSIVVPPGTGGLIEPATVAEQIVYEIADPHRYLLPDVCCDFRAVRLVQDGAHRVRASGARGLPAREIAPAATSMAQGITRFAAGRPRPSPVFRLFSFLIDRTRVTQTVRLDGELLDFKPWIAQPTNAANLCDPAALLHPSAATAPGSGSTTRVPLLSLAHGGSGDKGDTANVGIIARSPAACAELKRTLTSAAVRDYFSHVVCGHVQRCELPDFHALNFVLEQALGAGGVASLRYDPQEKAFAQMLLDMEIDVATDVLETLP